MAHEIRLAGPWEHSTDDESWSRCVLPFENSGQSDSQLVVLKRKFHRPSGLTVASRLAIIVQSNTEIKDVQINATVVANPVRTSTGDVELVSNGFDVSDCLAEFNVLNIRLTESGSRIESVKLRIEEAS